MAQEQNLKRVPKSHAALIAAVALALICRDFTLANIDFIIHRSGKLNTLKM